MRRLALLFFLSFPLFAAEKTVTLLHFSDYHSHALPFYTDEGERGGIARAIAFLERHKQRGALVFSGGDMVNKGAPAWSDKYTCAEWPWFNGIVDAMAFGNHDADYGMQTLEQCLAFVKYPILGANVSGVRGYRVFTRNGLRIGVFAVAGADFPQLVKTPGFTFTDPIAAARRMVRVLRDEEQVNAVVMIGHEHADADFALAQQVPGIDLIFGTHTHLKKELTQIPGTRTWFISPWQYLGYISWIELHFADGKLGAIDGALVPVDASMREDATIAQRVAAMQRALEADPQYSALFAPIATLPAPMAVAEIGRRSVELMRALGKAEVGISTTSSFRGALASGTLTEEALRAVMPYDNEIVVCTMTGTQLQRLAAESYASGEFSDAARSYRVATTDYVAGRDGLTCEKTGLRVRAEFRRALAAP
ncbi:MAG: bifunctional metallophosphatase/5'-nucleotidase [Acidobacteriota bacterium]|nr:bifunctional metallophosphatase/5'-nucleotidase [Acidobacteriota bacterium]